MIQPGITRVRVTREGHIAVMTVNGFVFTKDAAAVGVMGAGRGAVAMVTVFLEFEGNWTRSVSFDFKCWGVVGVV